jgi:hypothetical protein
MPGGEAVKRLDEDATRALWHGTEETADGHPESDPVPERRFLGEAAGIAAMDSPGLLSAGWTRCVGGRCGDPKGQDDTIEVGLDQARTEGGTKELGEKQARFPGDEESEWTRRGNNLSTLFNHQKCGRTLTK